MAMISGLLQRLYEGPVSKALDKQVQADTKVCSDKQESAAQECKEVGIVGLADTVVQPHAVVVKVLCTAVADATMLAAWPDIYL